MKRESRSHEYGLISFFPGPPLESPLEAVVPRRPFEHRDFQEFLYGRIAWAMSHYKPDIQRPWVLCVGGNRNYDPDRDPVVMKEAFAEMEKASKPEVDWKSTKGFTIAAVVIAERGAQRTSKRLKEFCKLASVEIGELMEHIDRRMARMQKAHEPQQADPRENRLPKHQITPEVMEERLRREFREYAETYRDRAKDFVQELVEETEKLGLLSHRKNLGLREAARRIAGRIGDTTFSDVKLKRYFESGHIKIGELDKDGLPKFSEYECETFVPPPRRQPGPKPREAGTDSKRTA